MNVLPIALVEPHEIVKEGFKRILNRTRFRIVLECASVDQIWENRTTDEKISAVLIDAEEHVAMIPADMERLRLVFPEAKIVLMSCPGRCRELMNVGQHADGLIFRTSRVDVLVKALELIVLGERIFPVDVWRKDAEEASDPSPPEVRPTEVGLSAPAKRLPEAFERLSEREIEVMKLLCNGDPNKVIARRLGISEATVKVHVKAILRKTQAKNRTEAALMMSSFTGFSHVSH